MSEEYGRKKLSYCMNRAENGEDLTIAFLGGSITQGSLASKEELTYAYRVYKWWCKNFPKATIHYVNGGIGGTTSHFGVARAKEDILIYQPDLVIIDFSVNDEPTSFYQETFEGVLRKILSSQSHPAVIVLNNVFYNTGINAQEYHNRVAEHYHVPFVSIKDTLYKKIQEGIVEKKDLTTDGLHPNDLGHKLVALEIIQLLEQIRKVPRNREAVKEIQLPAPLTINAYQEAKQLTIRTSSPVLLGFYTDTEEKKGHLDLFKNGWIGRKQGDKIIFYEDCSCIAIQYRKTIHKPSPVARVILDESQETAVLLDGNFSESWGDCLFLEPILHHGEKCLHKIEIELIKAEKEDQVLFYLVSLITA